jgi:hypothetical protein
MLSPINTMNYLLFTLSTFENQPKQTGIGYPFPQAPFPILPSTL